MHSRNVGVTESLTDPGTGTFPFPQQMISLDDNGKRFDKKHSGKSALTPQSNY
jgi:hypothetical protein